MSAHGAAVCLDEILDDRQAEPEPRVNACRGSVRLAKRFEDRRQEVRRDALAGVAHDQFDRVGGPVKPRVNGAALGRELHRIREQIRHDLLKTRCVSVDSGDGGIRLDGYLDTLHVGTGLHNLKRVANDVPQVDHGSLEPQFAGRDPRHVEQILDELRLPLGAVVNRLGGAIAQWALECAAAQHLGPSEDRVQRRAQLV